MTTSWNAAKAELGEMARLQAENERLRADLEEIVEQADKKFAAWRPLFGPDCTKPDAVQIDWALIEKARAALKGGERGGEAPKPLTPAERYALEVQRVNASRE